MYELERPEWLSHPDCPILESEWDAVAELETAIQAVNADFDRDNPANWRVEYPPCLGCQYPRNYTFCTCV
jgi:hypothetical protein